MIRGRSLDWYGVRHYVGGRVRAAIRSFPAIRGIVVGLDGEEAEKIAFPDGGGAP